MYNRDDLLMIKKDDKYYNVEVIFPQD
jgi:hypothetical protein